MSLRHAEMQIKFRPEDLVAFCGLNRPLLPRYRVRLDMADVHHEIVFFTGHVQGVGFRYTALQIAKEFEVAGFVRNLPDGRVHLEAEGAPSEVNAFVLEIGERLHGYVRKVERSGQKRSPQFSGFVIS